jgi:hypothetical protein
MSESNNKKEAVLKAEKYLGSPEEYDLWPRQTQIEALDRFILAERAAAKPTGSSGQSKLGSSNGSSRS